MRIPVNKAIELRQLDASDSADLFDVIHRQREYLGEWLPFVESTKEPKDTKSFVDSVVHAPEDHFNFVFTIRKQDELIGLVGFKGTDKQNQKTELGYWLSEPHQKQGIMTECVDTLCRFAFDELGINRIQIKCAVGNTPSKKIPQRLNFTLEGIERDGELLSGNVFTDLEVYSKLKRD